MPNENEFSPHIANMMNAILEGKDDEAKKLASQWFEEILTDYTIKVKSESQGGR